MPSASLSSVNVELVSSPSSLLTPLCFKSPAPKSRTSPFLTPFGPLPRFPSCYRKISRRRSRQGIRRPGCPAARNESESGAMGSSFGMVPVPGRRKEVVSDDEERGGTGEPPGPQTELEMGRLPLSSSSPSLRNQPLLAKADIDRDVMEETSDSKQAHQKKKSWIKRIKVFGVEMSPDTFAVSIVYFVQGVLGLSRLAVNFYLKDDLHLDPAETAVISGFSSLPWLVKPLYGFISDSFPIFGYRRRSYLILSGLLGAFSWSMMATMVDSKYDAAICILLGSLSVAFSDVVVDSMVVERARGETQSTSGSLQSLCWGSSAFGGIVSSYFSGSLVDAYGVRFVFSLTAILPLMTSLVAVLVEEKSSSGRGSELSVIQSGFLENSKQNMVNLWDAIKQPNIFLPTLFIFLWQATPHSDSAMFFYTTNKLRFSPEFLGRVKLVTSIASLAGVAIYNGFLKKVPLRKIFLWTTILGSILGMTQVILVARWNQQFGISDQWFAIGDSLILTVLGQASFMPVLVLAARLCPQGMEATLFATLMSISNGGSVAGGLLGAWLTQILGVTKDTFDNLVLLIVVCNLSSLLPLPLLGLLPEQSPEETNIELESKSN